MARIETLHFTASENDVSGALALPAGDARGLGVVLIQEWWGLNDHIRSIAGRLADAGFVTLAPDLYHGKVTKYGDEAGKLMNALDWPRALAEIGAAIDALRAHPRCNGKVAVVGFCMGGALTFKAATLIPNLAAAVPFYGVPEEADFTKVTAPVLAHFAERDYWAKPDGARAIQETVRKSGGTMELFVYDADHAFFNDTRPEVYSAACAAEAWERTVSFLQSHA